MKNESGLSIYVAGKDLDRAAKVMELLRRAGHAITYDWVAVIDDVSDLAQKAFDERQAAYNSDVLVYLWEEDQESARYEAGMAMGLNKRVIVSGQHQAHFFALPNVVAIESDDGIVDLI